MSFFITLVENSDAHRRAIESSPRVQAMMHKGLPLPEYLAFLRDLYHIVWHFCPIMAAAAARCGDALRTVRYELYERIEEEKGHEDWVLEDIAALGGNVKADIAALGGNVKADIAALGGNAKADIAAPGGNMRVAAPSAPVQAMIGFNYYAVERVHPCSVLGMLYVLEVVASVYGGKAADAIGRALERDPGKGGVRFLSSHATMDADHMAKLNVLLKTIEDPAAQAAIISSTQVNFHQFGQLFSDGGFVSHLSS